MHPHDHRLQTSARSANLERHQLRKKGERTLCLARIPEGNILHIAQYPLSVKKGHGSCSRAAGVEELFKGVNVSAIVHESLRKPPHSADQSGMQRRAKWIVLLMAFHLATKYSYRAQRLDQGA